MMRAFQKIKFSILVATLFMCFGVNAAKAQTATAGDLAVKSISSVYLPFIANAGQFNTDVLFSAELMPGSVAIKQTGLFYSFPSSSGFSELPVNGILAPTGEEKTSTTVNYFIGNDHSTWKSNVDTYNTVSFGNVFKGIAVHLKAKQNTVEKIFTVAPKANVALARFTVSKNVKLTITKNGELSVRSTNKKEPVSFSFSKPVAYQYINGKKIMVSVRYVVKNNRTYGFAVGSYNHEQELIIDPEFSSVIASTFIGGSGTDSGPRGVVLNDGSFYITGSTQSTNLTTTTGVYGPNLVGTTGLYVAKFADTAHLSALTYIGSPGQTSNAVGIALDESGNPFIYGQTAGSYPTTNDAFRTSSVGGNELFLSKFNTDLTQLTHSTLYGSSANESATSFAVDVSGNVYIYGNSGPSADLPTAGSPYDSTYRANPSTVTILAKFNSNFTSLLAATYLQASNTTFADGITLDANGNVWVTGQTAGSNFPTTTNAYQPTKKSGTYDAFITEFDSGLSTLLHSTYLGGTGDDIGDSLAFDGTGNIYLFGTTASIDFPNTTSTNGYQKSYGTATDFFIAKLDTNLTSLSAATYLGGSALEFDNGQKGINIVVNNYSTTKEIYVFGSSQSTSTFPTTTGAYQTSGNGGSSVTVITKFTADLQTLLGSTLINGNTSVTNGSLTLLPTGLVYLFGQTNAVSSLPIINSYQSSNNGGFDAFIAIFVSSPTISMVTPSTATAGAATTTVVITGAAFAPSSTVQFGSTALASSNVSVNSSTQITANIPSSLLTAFGTHSITVSNAGAATSSGYTFTINNTTPTITNLSQSAFALGGPNTTITITGTNFNTSSVATFNGTTLTTTYVNPTTLSAIVDTAVLGNTGTFTLLVANPAPGGGQAGYQVIVYNVSGGAAATVVQNNDGAQNSTATPATSTVLTPEGPTTPVINTTGTTPTTPTSPVAPSNPCIIKTPLTRTLRLGSTGADVKALQQYLNCTGFTLTSKGAGSKGKETNIFASLTKNALIKFQKAKLVKVKITLGTTDLATRAVINKK